MNKNIVLTDNEIIDGLFHKHKFIPSKFLYDESGDKIFQEIMALPEYYLTGSEYEILRDQSVKITDSLSSSELTLIEMGAGDGIKTRQLVKKILSCNYQLTYTPIDISANAINLVTKTFSDFKNQLHLKPFIGDYFEALEILSRLPGTKIVLFLGSNIGNFSPAEADSFIQTISRHLNKGDRLVIGADLIKSPHLIFNAYNDSSGITEKFNKNLLIRINHEFNANFDPDNFSFYASYNPKSGSVKSYLISLKPQDIYIADIDEIIHFDKWETIFTEISQKYTIEQLRQFATSSGFKIINELYDSNEYFVDVVWEKN